MRDDDVPLGLLEVMPDWMLQAPSHSVEPFDGICGENDAEPDVEPEPEPGPIMWAIPGVTRGDQPQPAAAAPSRVVRALRRAADAVAAVDPEGLLPEQAMSDAEELQAVGQLLRVVGGPAVGGCDRS